MSNSTAIKPIELYQSVINIDSIPGFQQIDLKSNQAAKAIKELTDTYLYASLCVDSASHFSQRIQELKFNNSENGRIAFFQACYKKYIHDVEELLDDLSKSITIMIQQNMFENYVDFIVSDIRSCCIFIRNFWRRFYEHFFTTGD
jgi:hypothetical protein